MQKKTVALVALFLIMLGALPSAVATDTSNQMPTPIYVGETTSNLFIRKERSQDAESVGMLANGEKAYILAYDPEWVTIVKGTEKSWVTGYVLRHKIDKIKMLEGAEYPFGTTPASYVGEISKDTTLYPGPKAEGDALFTLREGAKVAILEIENGWAKVIYWRQYGYFYMDAIKNLVPVYGEDNAGSGDYISAFISFYRIDDEGTNPNRMINIALACKYISIEMAPGAEFAFDSVAGPYRGDRGYLEGNSYFEGQLVPSTGGGVCQVSSTMYNVLLAMPKGIQVTHRRAHGPSGATYLPHGVDAAVGRDELNLIFKNINDFPVLIEAIAHHGVLFIAMKKV